MQTPQNGQTHSNNSSNNSLELLLDDFVGLAFKGLKIYTLWTEIGSSFFHHFSIKSKKYLILTSNNRNAVAGKIRFTDVEYQRAKNKSKNPNSGYLEEFFSLISWGSTSGSISLRIFKTIVINSCVRQTASCDKDSHTKFYKILLDPL